MLYFSNGILSMNKKVNKIIKQKLNYKKELQNRLPEETCNKIWEKIHQRLTSYYEEYKDILIKVINNEKLPIVYNVNFGHATPRCVLQYGAMARVDMKQKKIKCEVM